MSPGQHISFPGERGVACAEGQAFERAGGRGFPALCAEPGHWKVALTDRLESLPYVAGSPGGHGWWRSNPSLRALRKSHTSALVQY